MNYEQYVRAHVSEKDWKTLQEMGINLDTEVIADLWPDYVNIWERERAETRFLRGLLSEYPEPTVIDVASGSGTTTLGMIAYGLVKESDIVSNEININLREVADKEAKKYGFSLIHESYDWRDLDKYHKTFDAVLCLGNSLTMLLDPRDQKRALENFGNLLKPDGKLIIDVRNYAKYLSEGHYHSSVEVVYCGKDEVSAEFTSISEKLAVEKLEHVARREKGWVVVYLFGEDEFKSLLGETGFREITEYGDYKLLNPNAGFLTYVCKR